MHKRTAHRWRLIVVMTVGTALALGSFWLLQAMHNSADLRADANNSEPDYIVERFSVVRMSPAGLPRYIISGAKLTHRPIDDSSEIEKPVVQSLAADQAPMTIRSLRARVDHGNSQVHLMGDVDMQRAATPTVKSTQLKTQAMTILVDDDQMTTDQPVVVTSGTSTLNGVGMFVDNAKRQLDIPGKVRITYPPHP